MPAGWAAAAAAVVGAVASNDSSRHAANTQADAARAANATQSDAAAQARQDNLPWMNRGNQAGDRLQYLLGLDGSAGAPSGGQSTPLTADQLRQQLIGNYTSWQTDPNYDQPNTDPALMGTALPYPIQQVVDENGLNAEINARLQNQQNTANATASNDPAFGSLLRKFSSSDLANDPVYQSGLQFGLNQGVQGINRQAAATGSLNSGATLKALTRFGNDYGNTKAGEAYNRFTTDQNNIYNKLAGVSGTGQVANAQVGTSGMNAANQISANQIGVGNARAASSIANGNALSGAIGQGVNAYNQYNALNRNPNYYNGGGYNGSAAYNYNQGTSPDFYNNDGSFMSWGGGT